MIKLYTYHLLIGCCLLLSAVSLTGQNTVTGRVTDATGTEPLVGVNVLEKGTLNGIVTDLDGAFALTVTPGATLVISYIGYRTQEVPVNNRTQIQVRLEEAAEVLEEIVVTGYRTESKNKVASAISSVKAEDIERLPVLGMEQALQGQVAGLQVTQTTGAPGDDIAVRIRGVSTLGNNNPLFIIDGVPTTGNLNMFSTADIASIEVLKDGAAAAIYGSRAANGVVVITTKRGQSGAPRFNADMYYGIQEAYNLPELLNAEEYLTIRNEAIANANTLRDPRRQLPLYDPAILDTLPDVDWLDEMFDPAPMQRYMLSATGGSENGSYYVLGEYLNQEGVYRGQGFEKYLVRFNGELGGSGRFKLGNNIALSYTDRDIIGSSGDGAGPGNELSGIRYTLIAAPVFGIRNAQGEYINTSLQLADPTLYGDGNANPLAFVDHTNWNQKRYRAFGSIYAELKPFRGLRLRSTLGVDFLLNNEKIFKEYLSPAIYDPSSLTESRVIDQNLVWNNIADFSRSFGTGGMHQVSLLAGMEVIQNQTNYLGASASNFARVDPLFRYINNSVPNELNDLGVSGIVTEWGLLSFFGQAGYTFQNRYTVNATVRRDGSSRFSENNRYGIFPSVSAAWNVANEPFMDFAPWLSTLRLRASWGQLGNQDIGLYPYSSLVVTGDRVYSFGNQVVTGARVVETGNDNIKWETTTQLNYGLDLGLWEDRLSLSANYYIKRSEDILVRIPLPQIGGDVRAPYVNAGEIENKGFELSLNYTYSTPSFSLGIAPNISTVRNRVLSLAASEPILGGFGLSDGPITRTQPGYPVGSFFLYQAVGIFQTQEEIAASPFQTTDTRPGDIKFADINGDNVIDDKDRAIFGNPFPDVVYGLNLNLTYKNFDLSTLVQGVEGNDVYFLYGNFAYETQQRGFNSYREILNRWTPSNTNTDIPKVSIDDRNGNRRISTRFLEDGSYLRVRNITLGYSFRDLFRQSSLEGLRLYFMVQNAFVFTDYPGLDPEIQANTNDTRGYNVSSDLAVGIDWGTVPAPRIYMMGLNWNF